MNFYHPQIISSISHTHSFRLIGVIATHLTTVVQLALPLMAQIIELGININLMQSGFLTSSKALG
jgi:hypothetical protein